MTAGSMRFNFATQFQKTLGCFLLGLCFDLFRDISNRGMCHVEREEKNAPATLMLQFDPADWVGQTTTSSHRALLGNLLKRPATQYENKGFFGLV
jgi:hypothetical protein